MLDYCFGWPITFILKLFEDTHTLKLMVAWNCAFLITHIVLLLCGPTLYYNLKDTQEKDLNELVIEEKLDYLDQQNLANEDTSVRKYKLIIATSVLLGISFIISRIFIH